MLLGKKQLLRVLRIKEFGAYLGENNDDSEAVLLPKKECKGLKIGDEAEVFVYRDSEDRLICTTRQSKIECGAVASLLVNDINKIGAFLDMGLERDLFLPHKEMLIKPNIGDKILVAMYVDKSDRLAATMYIYKYLKIAGNYKKDDEVVGRIYKITNYEYLVAVDNKFYGAISKREVYENYNLGQEIKARVVNIRQDGKLDLSPREKAYIQLKADADKIYDYLKGCKKGLGFDDKAAPEIIKRYFSMSKNSFKRAVGHLLKEKKIRLENNDIRLN